MVDWVAVVMAVLEQLAQLVPQVLAAAVVVVALVVVALEAMVAVALLSCVTTYQVLLLARFVIIQHWVGLKNMTELHGRH